MRVSLIACAQLASAVWVAGCAVGAGLPANRADGGERGDAAQDPASCGVESGPCCGDGSCGDGLACTVGGTCLRAMRAPAVDAGAPTHDAGTAPPPAPLDAGARDLGTTTATHDAGTSSPPPPSPPSADPCTALADCVGCTTTPGCGFCQDRGTCESGDAVGSFGSPCAWAWNFPACFGL